MKRCLAAIVLFVACSATDSPLSDLKLRRRRRLGRGNSGSYGGSSYGGGTDNLFGNLFGNGNGNNKDGSYGGGGYGGYGSYGGDGQYSYDDGQGLYSYDDGWGQQFACQPDPNDSSSKGFLCSDQTCVPGAHECDTQQPAATATSAAGAAAGAAEERIRTAAKRGLRRVRTKRHAL